MLSVRLGSSHFKHHIRYLIRVISGCCHLCFHVAPAIGREGWVREHPVECLHRDVVAQAHARPTDLLGKGERITACVSPRLAWEGWFIWLAHRFAPKITPSIPMAEPIKRAIRKLPRIAVTSLYSSNVVAARRCRSSLARSCLCHQVSAHSPSDQPSGPSIRISAPARSCSSRGAF